MQYFMPNPSYSFLWSSGGLEKEGLRVKWVQAEHCANINATGIRPTEFNTHIWRLCVEVGT